MDSRSDPSSVFFSVVLFVFELRHRLILAILRVELPSGGQVRRPGMFGADGEPRQKALELFTATGRTFRRLASRADEYFELVSAFAAFVVVERHDSRSSDGLRPVPSGQARRNPYVRIIAQVHVPRRWYDA